MSREEEIEAIADRQATESLALSNKMKEFLVDKPGGVVGAALLELTAIWIAGHRHDIHQRVTERWLEGVLKMVPVVEAEYFGDEARPEGWERPA